MAVARLREGAPVRLGRDRSEMTSVVVVLDGMLRASGSKTPERQYAAPTVLAVRGEPVLDIEASERSEIALIEAPDLLFQGVELPAGQILDLGAESPLAASVAAFCAAAIKRSKNEVSSFAAYYLERLLQEMALALVVDSARAQAVPRTPDRFAAARAVIAAQVADPDLSPRLVAKAMSVSLRQLQRAFSERDTTVEREIRRTRVEEATRLLADPDFDSLTVEQIGRAVGMSGASSLARAFAAEGRRSPTQTRVASRGPGLRDATR